MVNYIDLIVLIILGLYIWRGIRAGFWVLVARFIAFIAAFAVSIFAYHEAGEFVASVFGIPGPIARIAGFFGLLLVTQSFVYFLAMLLFEKIPEAIRHSKFSRVLAFFPAALDGLIAVALFVLLALLLPFQLGIQKDISESYSGNVVARYIPPFEGFLQKWFGEDFKEAISFFTIQPASNERHEIPYSPKKLTISPQDEARMLELVNLERRKVGAPDLIIDPAITEVARKHSLDMWQRKYFSHVNPDGDDPFDRMKAGGVRFLKAGENLAYALNVELAHQGLMNSPGHKRNILDPSFRRVGIGVIDGGIYGQMFTQNFAN